MKTQTQFQGAYSNFINEHFTNVPPLNEKITEQPSVIITEKQRKDDMYTYYALRERIAISELCKLNPKIYLKEVTPAIGFDCFDCILSSVTTGREYQTEIKVRKRSSQDFENWFVEAKKVCGYHVNEDGKLERNDGYVDGAINRLFVTFFLDGVYFWDLNEIRDEKVFYQEVLRHQSVAGENNKVNKMITDVYTKDAMYWLPYSFSSNYLHAEAVKQFRELKGYEWEYYSSK